MLRAGATKIECDGWTNDASAPDWREIDRELRALAKQYVTLDAEQLRWLREAERVRLWRHVGFVSLFEYLEHVFGYSPRQAEERLRVARKLGALPELTAALDQGELAFSAVRELSRIATPNTERAWRDAARGKCLREIEELVAEREEGDLPSDRKKPDLRLRGVRFDLRPDALAQLRQMRQQLDDERGERLDDSDFIAALCYAASAAGAGDGGRAPFQIAITTCEDCRRAWQKAPGGSVAIDDAALARAECDAQRIGSLDAASPERAAQAIPPATRRLVLRRDGGRCCVPGCRSSRYIELHHVVHREHGGTHDPSNVTSLCDGHHAAHHRGELEISGTAPDRLRFERPHVRATNVTDEPTATRDVTATSATDDPTSERPHMRATSKSTSKSTKFADVEARVMAQRALTQLGWKPHIAKAAVAEASKRFGVDLPLEELIREALKLCWVT